MEIQHLITKDDVLELARPASRHIDNDRIVVCINEAEQIDIKKTIGDDLLLAIMDNVDGKYDELLEGGRYIDSQQKNRVFAGLRTVVSYYAYARLVQIADSYLSRFGFVSKDEEYSSRVSVSEKKNQVADVRAVADNYFEECITYMQETGILPEKCCGNSISVRPQQRPTYSIIGD